MVVSSIQTAISLVVGRSSIHEVVVDLGSFSGRSPMPPYIILSSYKYDGSNEATSLPRINGENRQST